ncbi:DUF547 domain-containing protein [Nitratireductor mangrovi]|uniref:DUF547 domain-containing protein n=1 Tax=Nitratireductor mangrovi TaxID=2599600 RepID=A0A5B8L0I0_9HYPH|nr:DUF547 domain-containing protein [Nitratireductor mangrovi]QDZ01180.2 DUF547 domain-containing protein [Nitratireductor mangrovi]
MTIKSESIDRVTSGQSLPRRTFLTGALSALASLVLPTGALAAPLEHFRPRGVGGYDHGAYAPLLARFVKPDGAGYNRVDYAGFKRDGHGPLKAYVAALQSATPSRFSVDAAHAFWINLYNAVTLDVVLDHYPVATIKNIGLGGGGLFGRGPWSKELVSVEETPLSLDDIEHRIIRPLFNDPMSHYALNCASYSCPNLAVTAFTGENVGRLMRDNAVAYVNHERGVAVARGRITASKIYSWYADDFGGWGRLKGHWTAFATKPHAAAIRAAEMGGYDYDWSLNDV